MAQPKADQRLSAVAGNYLIELTQPNSNLAVWQVEVRRAGAVATAVGELTRSYEFHGLAYAIYRTLENALVAPGATVKTARRAVVAHIDGELAMLAPSAIGVLKAEILQMYRAGFAADDELAAVA